MENKQGFQGHDASTRHLRQQQGGDRDTAVMLRQDDEIVYYARVVDVVDRVQVDVITGKHT